MIANACFSNIKKELSLSLGLAKSHIRIAMAWFTNNELMDELICIVRNGIHVDLILLDDELNHVLGADFNKFIQEGGNLFLYPKEKKFMHNKYCVIDTDIVITGSYNWTYYGEYRNCENIVISPEQTLIDAYLRNFVNLLAESNECNRFEIVPILEVDQAYLKSHAADFANEIYSCHTQTKSKTETEFERRISIENVVLPNDIVYAKNIAEKKTVVPRPKGNDTSRALEQDVKVATVITKVNDFKYAVSKYNIGFKAKLIDQNMEEGLKVLVQKGQALPFTITQDSRSANSGDENSMSAECELYYGETTELSNCQKFDLPLMLNNLPKMAEGEMKFKIMVSLNEDGELTVNFVCVNTKSGEKGCYTNINLVDYKNS